MSTTEKMSTTNLQKEKLKKLTQKSIFEGVIIKESAMREKEFTVHKNKSIKLSIFCGLFVWLVVGLIIKNILLSAAISIIGMVLIFIILLQIPIIKIKKETKLVEADLPLFLLKIIYEMRVGKTFYRALTDCSKENTPASREFAKVIEDTKKGATVQEAFERMNKRLSSSNIKRANSNLYNIYLQGTKDTSGLKKLAQELFLRQRIESKEFASKMVVYALVFIAVSAIVPAMFQSYIIIGSYFMKIKFSALTVLAIIVIGFPLVDLCILALINSKTPVFLKG